MNENFGKFLWEDLFCDDYSWDKNFSAIKSRFEEHINISNNLKLPVVISNEAICYYPVSKNSLESRISRLKSLLPNAKIVCVFRNQIAWLKSFYSSLIIDAGSTVTFDQFIEINKYDQMSPLNVFPSIDYNYIYDICKKYFDDLLFIPYEILSSNSSFFFSCISDFIGVDISNFIKDKKTNESNSPQFLSLVRAFNEKYPKKFSAPRERPYLGIHSPMYLHIKKKQLSGKINNFEIDFIKNVENERENHVLVYNYQAFLAFCRKKRIKAYGCEVYPLEKHTDFVSHIFVESNIRLNEKISFDLKKNGYF